MPKVYQSLLMSATMTEDVKTLKGLILRNPVRSMLFKIAYLYFTLASNFYPGRIKARRNERRNRKFEPVLCSVGFRLFFLLCNIHALDLAAMKPINSC